MADVAYLLSVRERALSHGDYSQARAITADLDRIGYREPTVTEVVRVVSPTGMETAAVRAPERAVPQAKPSASQRRKGGRPPLPRCPHGQIQGRCGKCNTAA